MTHRSMDPSNFTGERSIVLQEMTEADEAVRNVERRRNRHLLWSWLGVSPALVVPVVLGWDWSGAGVVGIIAASAAMMGYEALQAHRANRRLPELRRVADERRAEWESGWDDSEVTREA